MKHQNYLIVLFFFAFNLIHAQNIKSQAVTSSGAIMNQSNSKISFTVGEIVVKTITDGTNSIGQGVVNSSITNIVTAIKETDFTKIKLKVYPNPFSELVYVDITESKISNILLTVYDINGNQINSQTYNAGNNHIGINTQNWQNGNYIITISDIKGELLGSYKLLKQ
jgi:tricorn protease-like protein